jgi:hypothetical protein
VVPGVAGFVPSSRRRLEENALSAQVIPLGSPASVVRKKAAAKRQSKAAQPKKAAKAA